LAILKKLQQEAEGDSTPLPDRRDLLSWMRRNPVRPDDDRHLRRGTPRALRRPLAGKNQSRRVCDDTICLIDLFLHSGNRELYNLQNDLSETRNVAEANPGVVERLSVLMRRYIDEGRSTVGAPQKNDAAMSVDESSGGNRNKKKDKKARKISKEEVTVALDPNFD